MKIGPYCEGVVDNVGNYNGCPEYSLITKGILFH